MYAGVNISLEGSSLKGSRLSRRWRRLHWVLKLLIQHVHGPRAMEHSTSALLRLRMNGPRWAQPEVSSMVPTMLESWEN